MALVPLLATGAGLGAWAYATYEPNSPLFGRSIGRGPRAGRVAYLTFDDGPNAAATEAILDTLAADRVPAAFFMVGEHVRRFPIIARRVAAAGHEVGNHTLRHRKLHFLGPRRIREELERTHEIIASVTGRRRARSALRTAIAILSSQRPRAGSAIPCSVGRSACGIPTRGSRRRDRKSTR